jgi:hypothetical protein
MPNYRKTNVIIVISMYLIILIQLLAACGATVPTNTALPNAPTVAPTVARPSPTSPVIPTPTFTIPPTFTPFRAPPTPTTLRPTLLPTATSLPTRPPATPTPAVANLDNFSKIEKTFKASLAQALNIAGSKVDKTASLVLGQANLTAPQRPVWSFYLVKANKMWILTYDVTSSALTILDNQPPILLADVGLIDPAKLQDSDAIVRLIARNNFPIATPIDTVYVQMAGQPRVPVYAFLNSTFNRQLIVNALTGEILQNDFRG